MSDMVVLGAEGIYLEEEKRGKMKGGKRHVELFIHPDKMHPSNDGEMNADTAIQYGVAVLGNQSKLRYTARYGTDPCNLACLLRRLDDS